MRFKQSVIVVSRCSKFQKDTLNLSIGKERQIISFASFIKKISLETKRFLNCNATIHSQMEIKLRYSSCLRSTWSLRVMWIFPYNRAIPFVIWENVSLRTNEDWKAMDRGEVKKWDSNKLQSLCHDAQIAKTLLLISLRAIGKVGPLICTSSHFWTS